MTDTPIHLDEGHLIQSIKRQSATIIEDQLERALTAIRGRKVAVSVTDIVIEILEDRPTHCPVCGEKYGNGIHNKGRCSS